MNHPMPIVRGCGTRVSSGIYAECGCGPGGRSVLEFLCDPPRFVPDGLDVPHRGVVMREWEGTWHIFDRIGLQHYPNCLDFVIELQFGLSRRLPSNLDFSRLTLESRIVLIHDHARVRNDFDFDPVGWECPNHRQMHMRDVFYPSANPMARHPVIDLEERAALMDPVNNLEACNCIGYWWETIEGGKDVGPSVGWDANWQAEHMKVKNTGMMTLGFEDFYRAGTNGGHVVHRKMPSFEYWARKAPAGMEVMHQEGIIGVFPLTRLVVVKGDRSAETLEKVRECRDIEAEEVEE